MISATRNWFKRNRTNFAIGAGVLGAGYLATQYVLSKITEARHRMSDERIAKENLRRRFSQNQEDCTFTVLAILPTATENILQALPVEATLAELQRQKAERLAKSVNSVTESDATSAVPSIAAETQTDGEGKSIGGESFVHASQIEASTASVETPETATSTQPKKSKLQLWDDVKISSITRAFTLIYTLSLLTLLTRIQLNLLGRRTYLASVVSLASPPSSAAPINLENHDDDMEHSYGNDFETNRKYLSFSWWLLHRGCREILNKVQTAVKETFSTVSPREDLTLAKLSQLTLEVRRKVEGSTEEERRSNKWLPYLLPSPGQEGYVLQESGMAGPVESSPSTRPTDAPSLRRLLDETSDLIDSPPFTHVLTLLLDAGFSHLIDNKLAHLAYKLPPVSASLARIQEIINPEDAKAKVANSLAVFCRQAHSIGAGDSNEYLTKIEEVKDLEAFAAVVYSSHFEFEAISHDVVQQAASLTGVQDSYVDLGISRPPTAEGEQAELEKKVVEFEEAWGKALNKEDGIA
ncbi:peroxin-3 [Pseudovirgaria hyperparasitica]|uniref:Peroxin-3 n=1 Tax=Pseudovirgaria hyperparasitica TaxID=470096 RepID=A0A6A6W1Y3_9PEZI|nr:peroxin-3 [Pseudovirgaria hyperparasitica]KAF2756119.1 peroxin-3 [Pseudovirgaria hyperparasitica]